MAVKINIESIVKDMRKHESFTRLWNIFNNHETFNIPINDLTHEVAVLHKQRSVRKLNPTDPKFIDKLIIASMDDIASRARLTDILLRCHRANTSMTAALEALKYQLVLVYAIDLKAFSTKEERVQVATIALRPFTKFLAEVSGLQQSVNSVIADIDKASWSLKLTVDAIKLVHVPERSTI